MTVIVRKIMKYHRYNLRYSVVTVTLRMCCSSKSVCQVAVVSDIVFLFVTFNKSIFTTDMTFGSCEVSRVRAMLLMSVAYNFFYY